MNYTNNFLFQDYFWENINTDMNVSIHYTYKLSENDNGGCAEVHCVNNDRIGQPSMHFELVKDSPQGFQDS